MCAIPAVASETALRTCLGAQLLLHVEQTPTNQHVERKGQKSGCICEYFVLPVFLQLKLKQKGPRVMKPQISLFFKTCMSP